MRLGSALSLFSIILLVVSLAGCGQTYELVSLEITPTSSNVIGIGGTQQFAVIGKYSNTKTTDVTMKSTFTITPPSGTTLVVPAESLQISSTGKVQVVGPACTWTNAGTTDAPIYGTNPYVLKAKFENQEAVAFISVASLATCEYPQAKSTTTSQK